jgi:hypothetical protein
MLTIVWNANGFHVISGLSKGIEFSADHCITDLLVSLAEWRKIQVGSMDQNLIVHPDNARPHTAKMSLGLLEQNGKESHLPYPRDLVSSDFYLFGHVKQP